MTYYGANKQQYQLKDIPIKKGGEGAIHTVKGKSDLLAKIYLAPDKSPELQEKISLMVKNPPRKDILDQIAWPVDTLCDADGNFVGFVMPKLSIDVELGDVYKYPAKKNITLTGEQKVIIAINICRVISAIHDLDYVFGDFNPCNIGVNLTNGHVAFLDTDSYHITDKARGKTYRCNVCLNGYVAPELINKCKNSSYSQAPLPTFTKETDLFSLAIHIFKLLMNGYTPYNGIPESERSSTASPGVGNAAIEMDNYCFKEGNKPLSTAVLPLNSFPDDIIELFTRAFDEGHQNPDMRPTANEWDKALTGYHSSLKKCKADQMHFYFKNLRRCPYCEADQRYNYAMSMNSVYGSSSPQVSFPKPVIPPKPSSNARKTNPKKQRSFIVLIVCAVILATIALPAGGIFGFITSVNNGKISNVENLIDQLPDEPEYYIDYHQEIVEAYGAYNELSEKLRSKVENASKLFACMEGLEVEEAYEMQQSLQFTASNGGYAVSVKPDKINTLSGELVIPESYRGLSVTTIEANAFNGCTHLTSVEVPDSVKTIGEGAFSGCTGLKSITLPFVGSSRTSTEGGGQFGYIFGYAACIGCTDVTTSYRNWGNDNTFSIPSQLRSVKITDATQLSNNAFQNCSMLNEINLCDTITIVADGIFSGCSGIKEISLPNITEIPYQMFKNCTSLESFDIGSGVVKIGTSAFSGCSSLKRINSDEDGSFVIPDYIDSIGWYAFYGCTNVKDITLPFVGESRIATNGAGQFGRIFGYTTCIGCTDVHTDYRENGDYGDNTFSIPSQLRSVTITDATQLSTKAFQNCSFLTTLRINNAASQNVGDNAFANCIEPVYY